MSDEWIVAATLAGPVLAVQAQKWIERYREKRSQKISVFSTLIATRATPLSAEHVRALNTIDLAFKDDKLVIEAWREYLDSLTPLSQDSHNKFIDLLFVMGKNVGFEFDKVMLKRASYLPQAHVDEASAQADLRASLLAMLTGQKEIQAGLSSFLSGEKPLNVMIVNPPPPPPRSPTF